MQETNLNSFSSSSYPVFFNFPCIEVDVGRELHAPRGCCVILMGCKCIFCLILAHCARCLAGMLISLSELEDWLCLSISDLWVILN